jgi:hypothetical protein
MVSSRSSPRRTCRTVSRMRSTRRCGLTHELPRLCHRSGKSPLGGLAEVFEADVRKRPLRPSEHGSLARSVSPPPLATQRRWPTGWPAHFPREQQLVKKCDKYNKYSY